MNLNVNGKAPTAMEKREQYVQSPMTLIAEISRLMGDKIREKTDTNPISQKSGREILRELAKKDGRTQLELVKATHLKAPTISVVLQKLEKQGFVRRTPDKYDLRATRVFLTEKGIELDNTMRKRIKEEEALAMENLSDKEYDTLITLLEKIRNNILESENNEEDRI